LIKQDECPERIGLGQDGMSSALVVIETPMKQAGNLHCLSSFSITPMSLLDFLWKPDRG